MKKSDRKRFAAALADTFTIYDKPLSERALELWWNVLAGYKIDGVTAALSYHVANSEYCPRPANIVKLVVETLPKIAWEQSAPMRERYFAEHDAVMDDIRKAEASVALGVEGPWLRELERLQRARKRLCEDQTYIDARRQLDLREDPAPARTWLPPFLRRGLAALTGARNG